MMRWIIAILGTGIALALVATASNCTRCAWIDVRTQPLELSAGDLVASTPLVQQLPANDRAGPRTLRSLECTGLWLAEPAPASVRLRVREPGAADPLCEAIGEAGSGPNRVRFELGALALDPEVDYELELAPSGGAWRAPFAPLLRPRARLGARTRGETASEPLDALEVAVHCPEAGLSGIALQLARCPGGRAEFELLDGHGSDGSDTALRSGALQLSAAGARALTWTFDALPDSRAHDYRLRVRFERPHEVRIGRRGPAHVLLHGAPLARGPLGELRRGDEPLAAADLVWRIVEAEPRSAAPRSGRELTGLGMLVLAVFVAWITAARRPPLIAPAQD